MLALPGVASVPNVKAEGSPLDQFCCMILVTIPSYRQRLHARSQAFLQTLCATEYPLTNSFSAWISQDWILLSATKKCFDTRSKLFR